MLLLLFLLFLLSVLSLRLVVIYIYIIKHVRVCVNTMTTRMILRRCVVSAFLVFFSRISFAFFIIFFFFFFFKFLLSFSCRTKEKKKKKFIFCRKNRWGGGGAFKRRDFETRFSFSFLSKEGKKRYIRDTNHHLQKRTNALWKNTDTHTHTTRERKRRRFFLLWYILVVCLFCVRIICEDQREKERRHFIIASEKREREHRD